MIRFFITATILLFTGISHAQSDGSAGEAVQVKVTLENIMNDQGSILIALYDKSGFMSQPVLSAKSAIANGISEYTFEAVPPGNYAIIAMHDANSNGKMDFEPSGMPKEGWACSNNDMSMGPPDFDASKFEVSEQNLELTLRF